MGHIFHKRNSKIRGREREAEMYACREEENQNKDVCTIAQCTDTHSLTHALLHGAQ